MLSFFSGGKPKSPVATARASPDADGSAVGEVLSRAEAKLQQLRTSGGQDFPLLNEATRLGMHLTGTCICASCHWYQIGLRETNDTLHCAQFNR